MHSDRGSQYASDAFLKLTQANAITPSMSRAADCWDNAMAESFWATIKRELLDRYSWPTKDAARQAIGEWIENFYNRKRRHSSLGNVSPMQYEILTREQVAA